VTKSQAAYCWGENPYGGLGDGSTSARARPVRVRSTSLRFNQVVAGKGHSCGITTDSAAYCWGENDFGQLGRNDYNDADTAVAVTGGHLFSTISAHTSFHVCAVAISAEVYCWGRDDKGELGNGTPGVTSPSPVLASGSLVLAGVSAGNEFSCAWEGAGKGYCWGGNAQGRLGNGSTLDTIYTAPYPVADTIAFTRLSAGTFHVCGITSSGKMYCWGSGPNGALGHGDTVSVPTPQQVPGSGTARVFTDVTSGANVTCGVTTSKDAWCWGANPHGELGDPATGASGTLSPVKVAGGHSFEAVSAGFNHTCAFDSFGAVFCWGENANGSLGNGTLNSQPGLIPARVVNP
jgi:alpha-tubulin suppressor-like RCC1 family protein